MQKLELSDTESQSRRKRLGANIEPFPAKKRMLLEDAPVTLREVEGRKIMEIPCLLDSHVVRIIQQLKQASHEKDGSNDNVQILDQLASAYKNQLVALAKAGLENLQLCQDEQGRERERSENGKSF